MIEYFQDEKGEHRYRIKGANGEPMVTSEGYTRKSDAVRGYWDLVDVIGAHFGMSSLDAKAHRESVSANPAEDGAEVDEPAAEADLHENDDDTEGSGETSKSYGGSRHDEVPFDNPAALKQDDEDSAETKE